MRLRLLSVVPVVLAMTLVSGCSDDAKPSALPSDGDLAAYFEAVAAYDVEGLKAAEDIAADGSPAQGYAEYLGLYAASATAGGQPVEASEVEEVDGGFRACGGTGEPDECVTWGDFEGEGGKLADFTVNDSSLDDSLVDLTGQPPISADGLYTVQPNWAYLSPQSGSLFVLVTVAAEDIPLSTKPGIYIEQDLILNGVPTRTPSTIDAGGSIPVILAFPDAQQARLDGQVTFDVIIGSQSTEPVGFGLTDPAPADG